MISRSVFSRSVLGAAALLVLAAPQGAGASSPDEQAARPAIVDKAIALHGGQVFRHSKVTLEACSKAGCFDLAITTDGDRYEHVLEGMVGRGLLKLRLTKDEVQRWQYSMPIVLDAAHTQRSREFATARIYPAFLPVRLSDPGVAFQDLGRERWGERELAKVKATFKDGGMAEVGDEYLFWFDPATGRLEQFAYRFRHDETVGQEITGLRFRRGTNYREVGGMLFFDQENLGYDAPSGADAPQLKVEQVTPEFVAREMKAVSTVTFDKIKVEPLAASASAP